MKRICIDLDGVIANFKKNGESYSDVLPVEGAIEKLTKLKEAGHYIIIFTARHMKTCNGNVGQVIAKQGKATLDWLTKHSVPYDEIYFGKPWADIYIDDNALRFSNWNQINDQGSNLPSSTESNNSK
jgi:capsule biosynthesis phosphatase